MLQSLRPEAHPRLDLVLERVVDLSPEFVWKAWTEPERLKKWFSPAPYTTADCEIDLRPGGIFRTRTVSSEGMDFTLVACILEVIENRKFVWTSALLPGFRPRTVPHPFNLPEFTAIIALEPCGAGTKYTVTALHADEESAKIHDQGFTPGWNAALDQLIALAKSS